MLAPGDPGYERARLVFNTRFDAIRPPAVVRVRDTADVQAVVRWAGRHDVPLVVRSGGNAYNGASTSRAAVVVDVGGLDRFGVEDGVVDRRPGLRNWELYRRLARRGLALPSGSCPNVALGGLATGGGMGLAGRALGLTLDRVTAFDVVTADGERRRVRGDDDLFWALRGGGGSFAVVTAVRLRAAPPDAAPRGSSPPTRRAPARRCSRRGTTWRPARRRELTSICTLTGSRASAFGQYLGSEARAAPARRAARADRRRELQRRHERLPRAPAPLGRLRATAAADRSRATASTRRRSTSRARLDARRPARVRGGGRRRRDARARRLRRRDQPTSTRTRPRSSTATSASASRSSPTRRSPTARRRVRRARSLIAPFGNGGAYQNYADLALRSPRRAYYGANLERLQRIKAAVDPDDRFRPAQGVR